MTRSARGEHRRPGAAEHWTEREIDETAYKDVRLGRRFGELLKQIGDGMGESIPFACQDWANTKAAYRFFANERVEEGDILSGHFAATRARYDASEGPILLIQDTTEFSYQRANVSAAGVTKCVNSGRDKHGRLRHHTVCGMLMHSSLAVTTQGNYRPPFLGWRVHTFCRRQCANRIHERAPPASRTAARPGKLLIYPMPSPRLRERRFPVRHCRRHPE